MDLIIRNICELPVNFSVNNKSPLQLAMESGFLNYNKEIKPVLIKKYLENHPHLIEEWIIWSENKRTDKGYFLQLGDKFIVGYIDSTKKGLMKTIEYKTALDACSDFILLEICSILNIKDTGNTNDL